MCLAKLLSLVGLGLIAITPAFAQTSAVFPVQASGAEGESGTTDYQGGAPWWPKASVAPNDLNFRLQTITDLPSTASGSLKSIAYRRDSANYPGRNHASFSVDMEVTVSTAPTNATTASAFFAANTGADLQTVVTRKRVNFGANTWTTGLPEPFNYTIRFDTPFNYTASGSLCVDIKHYDNDLFHPLRFPTFVPGIDVLTSSPNGGSVRGSGYCFSSLGWEPPIQLDANFVVNNVNGTDMLRAYATRQYAMHHSRGYLIASAGLSPVPIPAPGAGACGQIDLDLAQLLFVDIAQSDDYYGIVRWPDMNPLSPYYNPNRQYLFDLPYNQFWAGYKIFLQEVNYNVHNQQFSTSNFVAANVPVYLPAGQQFGARIVYTAGPTSHSDAQGTVGALGIAPVTRFNF